MTTWNIDPAHSGVDFSVKHMMVATVRGDLAGIEGVIDFDEAQPTRSSVEVRIPTASVNTGMTARDVHLRSADFFDAERFPYMTFKSTAIVPAGDAFRISGDLTIRDVTRSIVLDATIEGVAAGLQGSRLAGFEGHAGDPALRLGPDLEQGARDWRLGCRRRDRDRARLGGHRGTQRGRGRLTRVGPGGSRDDGSGLRGPRPEASPIGLRCGERSIETPDTGTSLGRPTTVDGGQRLGAGVRSIGCRRAWSGSGDPTRLAILRRTVLTYLVACLALAITAGVLSGPDHRRPWPAVAGRAPAGRPRQPLLDRPPLAAGARGRSSSRRSWAWSSRSRSSSCSDGSCPESRWTTPTTAVWAAVLLTVLNSLFAELVAVSDDNSYYGVLVRRLVARDFGRAAEPTPGLLVVQIDGLSLPVLRNASRAGRAPVLGAAGARRRGDTPPLDRLAAATTPASQAGILHGRTDGIPGFRWYEKATARLHGGQPPRRRRRDRPSHQRRHGSPGRGRSEHRQPRHRRRATQLPDDGHDRGGRTGRRRAAHAGLLRHDGQLHPPAGADGRRDGEGAVPGGAPARPGRRAAHAPRPARSPSSAPSPTSRCAPSRPPSSSRRCTAGRRPSTWTTPATTPSRTTAARSARRRSTRSTASIGPSGRC